MHFSPQIRSSFYFSHDCNARNDNKVINLRIKHGMRGYGIYFGIIELLMESKSYQLPLDFTTIAYDLREDAKSIEDIVMNYGLFTINCTAFWSDSLKERMKRREEVSARRSEAGKRGAAVVKQKRLPSLNPEFEKLWQAYPVGHAIGKKVAIGTFLRTVKSEQDKLDIWTALNNYKASKRVQDGFVQNGSTWFNQWKDWIVIKAEEGAEWKKESHLIRR